MFGGPNAIEIVKSIEDIEASFLKHLEALHPHNLKYDILDVKNTEWHEDHNAFKTSLRHLEVMTNNVIRSACAVDGLPNVSAGVELLEAFQSMAKRESIKILLVSDLPCNVRREGGKSLVIEGPSLVVLEGKECNPL